MLRTLMLLAGTLAVLFLGGVPAQAAPDAPPPACHEAPATSHSSSSHHTPDKAMKAMSCCAACVGGIGLPLADLSMTPRAAPPASTRPTALPTGRAPAPEHGPPRA